MRPGLWVVLATLAVGCDKGPPASAKPPASASVASVVGSSTVAPPPPPSAVASAPAPSASASEPASAKPPNGIALVESAKLQKLVAEPGGRFVAELERTPPARAIVVLATKEVPLGPREVAAHFRIAEQIAPGLVAPTALRALPLTELASAADAPTRAKLQKLARVLADGSVEVALVLAPAANLTKVNLQDVAEGQPAQMWEMRLGARDPIPEAELTTLALYQSLLAVDYVAQNGSRKAVFLHKKSGRITASDGNFAFARPSDGAVTDTIERLSRHVTFSKSLRDHLVALNREGLARALTWGEPPVLLVTPKQIDEAVDHAHAIRRVIEQREKQRGDAALGLP